jgi:V/A-type H+-transporting ATPase subunit F
VKFYVIGERELVLAFGLAGVQGTPAVTRNECLEAFNRVTGTGDAPVRDLVADERPRVLILTEAASVLLEDEVRDWQMKGKYPLIVEIPGIMGHLQGRKTLMDSIREAIGIHV